MAFFGNILGNVKKCVLFSYKYVIKIPLLYEIQPFDNTEKVYESNSGHTIETRSKESPDWLSFSKFQFFLKIMIHMANTFKVRIICLYIYKDKVNVMY